MSTRCHIEFLEECITNRGNKQERQALLYRHSDGYPGGKNGVLALLLPFLSEFWKERGDNYSYMAARFVQKMCNEYDKQEEQRALGGQKFLGHAISNSYAGDVEYLYQISPNGINVQTDLEFSGAGKKCFGKKIFSTSWEHLDLAIMELIGNDWNLK